MNYELKKDTKIYVAGHKGLIGSAFIRFFENNGYSNIVVQDRNKLDLCSKKDTFNFFQENQPEVVILAAGRVGGIIQNRDFPADFINENLSIQLNVFGAAYECGVKRLVFFASSCMYPRNIRQPMKEEQLNTGPLEQTSIAYATAKYTGVQMCNSINQQIGHVIFIPVIPNSVFGPNDNFDLNSSHVLSALIRRFYEAKIDESLEVTLWGTGSPKREFIFVDDLVEACCKLLNVSISIDKLPINIGVGYDISIKSLAEKISRMVGYSGKIKWDKTKPDGAPRKLLDNNRIEAIGWKAITDFDEGLEYTYQWYLKNISQFQ